ncbi:MAG: cob(I)yrinic acid a,c-diamide adenosyltransferase [Longimicrobiaceae bacterium]
MTSKLYTKTGDRGETGLFGGGRVPKDHVRVEAYGAVDELNSAIGVAAASLKASGAEAWVARLVRVQEELFTVGARLATPGAGEVGRERPSVPALEADAAAWLERWIDELEDGLPPLKLFILPGGSEGASLLHLARTVCRRAERRVVTLSHQTQLEGNIITYLNRLSDLLFALARAANREAEVEDVPWRA